MPGGKHIEAITMHVFIASNMSTMISKENLYSLQMRHLTPSERDISYVAMQNTGSQPDKSKTKEEKKAAQMESNDQNTKIVYMA
jgi:hypothetical protein